MGDYSNGRCRVASLLEEVSHWAQTRLLLRCAVKSEERPPLWKAQPAPRPLPAIWPPGVADWVAAL